MSAAPFEERNTETLENSMKNDKKSPRFRMLLGFCCLLTVAASAFAVRQQDSTEEPKQEAGHTPSLPVDPDEAQLRTFIELIRQDVQTEKATILAVAMQFTEDEAFEFWPVYREYSLELEKLFDVRLKLIRKYVGSFEHLTDDQARALAKDVFDLEERRLKLKRTWFEEFATVVSPKRAAQVFQIENQINAAIDLRVAASLPLIQ